MANAKKLKSGNWRVRAFIGRDIQGKPMYKSFTADSKRAAERMAAVYTTEKRLFEENMRIKDAVDSYIESRTNVLSPTTIFEYKRMARDRLIGIENIHIGDITNNDLQRWVNRLASKLNPKTVKNTLGLVHAAITSYRPELIINVATPKRIRRVMNDLPTSEEIISIVHGTDIELPVLLALWLCLRMSEVRGIKKSSIKGNTLYIENSIVTVNGKHVEKKVLKTDSSFRCLELPDILRDMIMENKSEYATTLTGKAIYGRFRRIMKKNGYDGVRFHDLRHIAASDMHKLGIPDRVAADRGGWSTTATMKNVYQHSFTGDREFAERTVSDYYTSLVNKCDK